MTDGQRWGVPPHMPPPTPAPNFAPPPPPPPAGMPPPVPGTGASSQYAFGGPPYVPARVPQQNFALDARGYLHPEKSLAVAYVLWFFFGFLGVHHFYLGKVGRGVGYLVTFGWFMIGPCVDLFTLPAQVRRINYEQRFGRR